mgnify:CR=1 FL=1
MTTAVRFGRALYLQNSRLGWHSQNNLTARWMSSSNPKKGGSSDMLWHAGTFAAFAGSFVVVRWGIKRFGGSISDDSDEFQEGEVGM